MTSTLSPLASNDLLGGGVDTRKHPLLHNGRTYTFDPQSDGEAIAEYIGDRANPRRHWQADYKYKLYGAHDGEPMEVWMLNVHESADEYGYRPDWEALAWADDDTPLDDDYLHDFYAGALSDELMSVARETWR